MITRIIGAGVRAGLMAFLVAVPSGVLPGTNSDAAQIVSLLALALAVATFAEYYSEYPTFLEFRDAAPFNRLRFMGLFFALLFASLLVKSAALGAGATLVIKLADYAAGWLDFPFSPVRLLVIALADRTGFFDVELVRRLASLTFAVSMVFVTLFVIHVRLIFWPIRKTAFNFWINLPLFDPTAGGDVISRLKRDANINLALGFLLPFVVPAVLQSWQSMFDPDLIGMPQATIWIICGWAFIPMNLIMRGLALMRIASLIEEKRRRAYAQTDELQTV